MNPETLEKRKLLQSISIEVVKKAQGTEFEEQKVNSLIKLFHYKLSDSLKLNTFHGWLKEGYKVKKSEKAFLFWGQPLKHKEETEENKEAEEPKGKFFPLCYLFSNLQVTEI